MQLADSVGRSGIAVLAASLLFLSVASAADLTLEPIIILDDDLIRVLPTADGATGVLRTGGIDFVSSDGTVEAVARAAESQTLYLGDGGDKVGVATHRIGAADFAPTATFELRDRSGAVLAGRDDDELSLIGDEEFGSRRGQHPEERFERVNPGDVQ